jgi:hypothetical protein
MAFSRLETEPCVECTIAVTRHCGLLREWRCRERAGGSSVGEKKIKKRGCKLHDKVGQDLLKSNDSKISGLLRWTKSSRSPAETGALETQQIDLMQLIEQSTQISAIVAVKLAEDQCYHLKEA